MLKWMMKMEKKRTRAGNTSKKRNYSNVILVILIAIFVFSLIKIIFWLKDNKKISDGLEEIVDIANITEIDGENVEEINPPEEENSKYSNDYFYYMSLPFMSVQFDKLKEKNEDTVAWLKVAGTQVNYPVVQTDNNDYYLTHAFDKSVNEAGWLFADYRCDLDSFRKK